VYNNITKEIRKIYRVVKMSRDLININDIRIVLRKNSHCEIDGSYLSFYYWEYNCNDTDSRGRPATGTAYVSYYEIHKWILTWGEIKIKNYFVKNFDSGEYTCYFPTEEKAKEALEWFKQKAMETTLVGKETLQSQVENKKALEKQKRIQREKNKAADIATGHITKFQEFVGKEITFPVQVMSTVMEFKAILLSIKFDDGNYVIKTSAGEISIPYKNACANDNEFKTTIGGYYHEPTFSFSGGFQINF
jgi:hypothetical protein